MNQRHRESIRAQIEALSIAARPAIMQIGAALRRISTQFPESAARGRMYHAKHIQDGARRHRAVKHAKDELRRVRKITARQYR